MPPAPLQSLHDGGRRLQDAPQLAFAHEHVDGQVNGHVRGQNDQFRVPDGPDAIRHLYHAGLADLLEEQPGDAVGMGLHFLPHLTPIPHATAPPERWQDALTLVVQDGIERLKVIDHEAPCHAFNFGHGWLLAADHQNALAVLGRVDAAFCAEMQRQDALERSILYKLLLYPIEEPTRSLSP